MGLLQILAEVLQETLRPVRAHTLNCTRSLSISDSGCLAVLVGSTAERVKGNLQQRCLFPDVNSSW